MSHDEELRTIEREILLDAGALEPRRRHAQALLRAGQEDRGLAAIDLAWRLGADDLWDDLRARLDARAIKLPDMELRYVPGGPFAMGADDLDADTKPLHVVNLSAFYVASKPVTRGALDGWRENYAMSGQNEQARAWNRPLPFQCWNYTQALNAVVFLAGKEKLGGRPGKWALISEAQWERVFRASLFRKDLVNPYGATLDSERVEWMLDEYDPEAYAAGPRRDPVVAGTGSGFHSVRAIPKLGTREGVLYREAADENGRFEMQRGLLSTKYAGHEAGFVARPVFVPAAAP